MKLGDMRGAEEDGTWSCGMAAVAYWEAAVLRAVTIASVSVELCIQGQGVHERLRCAAELGGVQLECGGCAMAGDLAAPARARW